MTKKIQRRKTAKRYRRLFKVDFILSFKCAKEESLPLSAVHPSLQRYDDVVMCNCGHIHNVVRVYATNGGLYTFIDGYLW